MPTILFESDDLLVLNKPAGLIVHSDGRTVEPSVAAWLLEHYPVLAHVGEPWLSPQGERVPLAGIVHRLDRGTSGVLLVAKTQEMYAYLKNEFKARRVEKVYRAYVRGCMETEEGRIVAEIARSSTVPKKWYAKSCEESDVRAAITEWKLLENLEGEVASIEVLPKTGRTHQIRVHLASIGHPVIGDPLYSDDDTSSRMYLHAHRITVTLPAGSATFTAPLPAEVICYTSGMKRYACTGSCGGESDRPGNCQAKDCNKYQQPLVEVKMPEKQVEQKQSGEEANQSEEK